MLADKLRFEVRESGKMWIWTVRKRRFLFWWPVLASGYAFDRRAAFRSAHRAAGVPE